MADVTKIKLPDNSTVNIKDYRIPGVDTTPTSGSDNLVTSGGVYQSIEDTSLVTSAAINDLNDRLLGVEDGDWVTTEELYELEGDVKNVYTIPEIDEMFSDLENTYLSQETDPTVPAWAKTPNKPSYTAIEVGALPNTTSIPTKTSDLTNDSDFTTKTYVDAIKYASSKTVGGPADKAISIPFATVSSSSTASAFSATISEITELRDGICFYLRNNQVTSSLSGWTLNINNLGAKPVYVPNSLSTRASNQFESGCYCLFIYNTARVGTGCFDICQLVDTNTTYTNESLGHGYATCSTAYGTTAKTAACSGYILTTGGYITVSFTNDVCANATLNVNDKGAKAIYYQGAPIGDKVIKAGDTALFIYSTNYYLISIDRGGGSVTQVNIGSTQYTPIDGIISLPAYPTTLPASDVYAWAKASTKPTYTATEVGALPSSTVIPAAPGTLTTTSTTALSTATNEALSGNISLHKVAKTGTYNDLVGKPTIPAAQVQSDWNATSGMGVILNKPTIPTIEALTTSEIDTIWNNAT